MHLQIVERPAGGLGGSGVWIAPIAVARDVVTDLEPGERDVVHAARRYHRVRSGVGAVECRRAGERVTRLGARVQLCVPDIQNVVPCGCASMSACPESIGVPTQPVGTTGGVVVGVGNAVVGVVSGVWVVVGGPAVVGVVVVGTSLDVVGASVVGIVCFGVGRNATRTVRHAIGASSSRLRPIRSPLSRTRSR